jgi:hypothetical protein
MSASKEIEMSNGQALFARYGRFERRRRSAASRPAWSELNRAEKARVLAYSLLLALVVAFVVTVLAAAV